MVAAAILAGVSWAKSGLACSIVLDPPHFEPSAKGEATGTRPSPLQLKRVRVTRSKRAPPGPGDCSEIGGFALDFALSSFGTEARKMGVALKLIKGELPLGMTLAGGPYKHENGVVSFGFADYPDEAFSFTLAARAVDATGNQSSPVEVVVKGDPQPSRSTGRCSMSAHLGHSQAWGAVFLLGVALLLTRRLTAAKAAGSRSEPLAGPFLGLGPQKQVSREREKGFEPSTSTLAKPPNARPR